MNDSLKVASLKRIFLAHSYPTQVVHVAKSHVVDNLKNNFDRLENTVSDFELDNASHHSLEGEGEENIDEKFRSPHCDAASAFDFDRIVALQLSLSRSLDNFAYHFAVAFDDARRRMHLIWNWLTSASFWPVSEEELN